jgi:hypothetical protein
LDLFPPRRTLCLPCVEGFLVKLPVPADARACGKLIGIEILPPLDRPDRRIIRVFGYYCSSTKTAASDCPGTDDTGDHQEHQDHDKHVFLRNHTVLLRAIGLLFGFWPKDTACPWAEAVRMVKIR